MLTEDKRMGYQHKNLAAGRWRQLSFVEQMANSGAMKTNRLCYIFLIISAFLCLHAAALSQPQETVLEWPEWWDKISFEMPAKDNVVDQYFYIIDNILDPAYKSSGAERELLFKKSIIAFTRLIEAFAEKKDMVTSCTAQYQIAEAYRRLQDTPRAREAYRRCLGYQKYIKDPPKDAGDTALMAVIGTARKKLEGLR